MELSETSFKENKDSWTQTLEFLLSLQNLEATLAPAMAARDHAIQKLELVKHGQSQPSLKYYLIEILKDAIESLEFIIELRHFENMIELEEDFRKCVKQGLYVLAKADSVKNPVSLLGPNLKLEVLLKPVEVYIHNSYV